MTWSRRMPAAWLEALRIASMNGAHCASPRAHGLKGGRPQSCPSRKNSSGGAPTRICGQPSRLRSSAEDLLERARLHPEDAVVVDDPLGVQMARCFECGTNVDLVSSFDLADAKKDHVAESSRRCVVGGRLVPQPRSLRAERVEEDERRARAARPPRKAP